MNKDPAWKEKLRQKAERHAAQNKYVHPEEMTPEDVRIALHELNVHQIELEMQNEELRLAQAEIESARERYFDLYDLAPVGYCTLSEKGIILEANLTLANLFGAVRSEVIGKPFSRYVYREDQDTYYLHKLRLCGEGEAQNFKLRMKKGDAFFWAGINATVLEGADGQRGCRVTICDITEHKRMEEKLVFQAGILSSVHDAIFADDGNYLITYWNGTAEKLFGWTAEEAIGRHSGDLLQTKIPGSSREAGIAKMLKDNCYEGEAIYRHKDGSEVYTIVHANVIRDNDGKVIQIISSFRDITMQKKAEEALRESEERYRGVVQNTSAIILRVDPQGIIRFVNQRALEFFGYEEEELVGKHSVGTIIPEQATDGRDLSAMAEEILADPDRFHTNANENMRKNGERVCMEWTNSGVYNSEGNLIEFLAVGIDVTDRRRAEEALRESEEREAFLLKLSDTIRELDEPSEIQDTVARIVGEHMGADRAGYGEMTWEDGKECIRIERDYHTPGMPDLTGKSFPVDDYGPAVADSIRSGQTLAVEDIETDERFTSKERKAYNVVGIRAVVNVPLIKGGKCAANFSVQQTNPRRWTPNELMMLEETVARTWVAVERAKAEEALRKSEEKYRELVEHSPAAIYEIDFRAGRFTTVNDAMCEITGYSRDELLDLSAFEILDGQGKIKFNQRVDKWLLGEKPEETAEFRVIGKNGKEIFALLNVKFTRDEKGEPLGASVIGHDITERKQNEEKINRQNMILQAIKKIYEQYVYCGTLEELGEACLNIIEDLTKSKISFINELSKNGLLHDISFSPSSKKQKVEIDGDSQELSKNHSMRGLFKSVILEGKSLLSNGPSSHPDGMGVPQGHHNIESLLGVPFFHNGKVAGMIAVANREGGYTEDEKEMLEALAPTVCEVMLRKRTEKALKESENKYQQLVKYAPAGIFEIDFRKRRFLSVNDIMCQLSGYSREELLAMGPYDLLDEHSKAMLQARIGQWLKGEELEQIVDYRVKARDGRMIDVLMNVSITLDEKGKPAGATAVAQDITRRKRDETVINRKNRILQVINHIHERSVSCRTMNELELACLDIVGAVTNSSVSFIGELKGERLMYEISLSPGGRNGTKKVRRRLGRLNGEGLFKDVIDSKSGMLVSDISSGIGSTGVNGSDIKISSFLGVPFIRDGEVLGLIATANREGGYTEDEKEILEALAPTIYEVLLRKRAEEALKESEERLADEFNAVTRIQKISASFVQEGDFDSILYNILKAAIMIAGAYKGTLQLIRPGTERLEIAAQLGFDQSFIDFFSSVAPDSDMVCAKALQQEERIIVEDVAKSPVFMNTPVLDIQLTAGVRALQCTPLISRRGKVIGILSTHWDRPFYPNDNILRYIDLLAGQAADIIERKRTEEDLRESEECALALVKKLEEADRNKNSFLSALSHEIRNPLATISAGLQLMDISQDERQVKNAKEIINRQMEQLCSLVDDLLDLTRISNNRIELKKKRVELNRLVSLVAKDHILHADKKNLKFETELGEDIYVDADPVRLKQIIGNMLHNAFKFTETGGVNLSVYEENGQAVICVRDSGVGISPENLSKIFEPFMQIGSHMNKLSGGLGLGLSIVKSIAQLHGGDAGVYSEGKGMGSSFFIRLPVIKEEAAGEEESNPRAEGANLKVLLIEDNRDYSEMTCELLRFLGHEVVSAADGAEGIEKANEYIPDVIICDIGLPGINGFETARRIRKEENIKNVFLVSLTGYAGPQYAEDSKKAGFDMHITKPVDIDALRRILNEVSGKHNS